MGKKREEMPYGPVAISGGPFKGQVVYYDDDEDGNKAICYLGHPIHFVRHTEIPKRFMRELNVDYLVKRDQAISQKIIDLAIKDKWNIDIPSLHELWSEKSLISEELYQLRMMGGMKNFTTEKSVFLCHSSSDKGFVRMVNDDLRRLGAETWLDENIIKVGDSIVGKISDGVKSSKFMIVFLSKESVKSLWATREWQSFLSRQLRDNSITILPLLIEQCEIPAILSDIKYADFTDSYHDGLNELHLALQASK